MAESRIIIPATPLVSANGDVDKHPDIYARARQVRFFEVRTVYSIISRTRGNLFLLRPDRHGLLRRIFAGVLAEAKAGQYDVIPFPFPFPWRATQLSRWRPATSQNGRRIRETNERWVAVMPHHWYRFTGGQERDHGGGGL